jgi:hypothetical protein
MRPIYIVALLPVIMVLCWVRRKARPKKNRRSGWAVCRRQKRRAERERRTGHGLQVNYERRFLEGNKFALSGEINFLAKSAPRSFFKRHVSDCKLRQSLCHARRAAKDLSKFKDLAGRGHRRRIRGL